jgi:hypothetical protein
MRNSSLLSSFVLVGSTLLLITTSGCQLKADRAEVEKTIQDGMKGKNLTLKTIKCPDNLTPKKGDSFQCDATDELDTAGKIKVTWGDDTKFDIEPVAVVNEKKAGDNLSDTISKNAGSKFAATCPEKLIFAKKGGTFSCDATGEAEKDAKYTLEITMTDDTGQVSGSPKKVN